MKIQSAKDGTVVEVADSVAHALVRDGSATWPREEPETVPPVDDVSQAEVREWAQGKGIPVNDRGRISDDLKRRYLQDSGSS